MGDERVKKTSPFLLHPGMVRLAAIALLVMQVLVMCQSPQPTTECQPATGRPCYCVPSDGGDQYKKGLQVCHITKGWLPCDCSEVRE